MCSSWSDLSLVSQEYQLASHNEFSIEAVIVDIVVGRFCALETVRFHEMYPLSHWSTILCSFVANSTNSLQVFSIYNTVTLIQLLMNQYTHVASRAVFRLKELPPNLACDTPSHVITPKHQQPSVSSPSSRRIVSKTRWIKSEANIPEISLVLLSDRCHTK